MRKYFLLLIIIGAVLPACKKENANFISIPVSNYFPLKTGNYITYNLDSTIFINFGAQDTVKRYLVQDRVDSQVTDNQGRKGFRIIRFIRRNISQPWIANNTFMAIPTAHSIEYIENNHRFLKLVEPIENGYTWKGNSFIDTYSIYSDVKYLDDWDYTYDSVNVPITLGTLRLDSTIKVKQRNEFLGQDPHLPSTQYAEKNYSIEKFAKGIGLVYKEFLHWEYQGGQPGRAAYYLGYGVKLTMIDHN